LSPAAAGDVKPLMMPEAKNCSPDLSVLLAQTSWSEPGLLDEPDRHWVTVKLSLARLDWAKG
jgi:hypothetical protein